MGMSGVTSTFVNDILSKLARAIPNPEGDRRARVAGRQLIEVEIEVAILLEAMNEGLAFAALGCSCIGHCE